MFNVPSKGWTKISRLCFNRDDRLLHLNLQINKIPKPKKGNNTHKVFKKFSQNAIQAMYKNHRKMKRSSLIKFQTELHLPNADENILNV